MPGTGARKSCWSLAWSCSLTADRMPDRRRRCGRGRATHHARCRWVRAERVWIQRQTAQAARDRPIRCPPSPMAVTGNSHLWRAEPVSHPSTRTCHVQLKFREHNRVYGQAQSAHGDLGRLLAIFQALQFSSKVLLVLCGLASHPLRCDGSVGSNIVARMMAFDAGSRSPLCCCRVLFAWTR